MKRRVNKKVKTSSVYTRLKHETNHIEKCRQRLPFTIIGNGKLKLIDSPLSTNFDPEDIDIVVS